VVVGAEGHLVTPSDLPVAHLEYTTRVTLRFERERERERKGHL